MILVAMAWDVRALFAALDFISRVYVFFLILAGIWGIVAWFRFLLGIRSVRAVDDSSLNQTLKRLEAAKCNLRQLFVLALLFFGACFCVQLLFGLRSMTPAFRAMDGDSSPPFDALFALTLLSFTVLGLLQIIHWHLAAKLHAVQFPVEVSRIPSDTY
jgi:hypothetical protein